ncbi:hypothetical protein GCM10027598_82620 [Amycolatopsis oliviviridis]|uniref:DUF3558 domain-containing protein n=1 Tax=Amycolatopsis oliviviridis TaxID=1471590 RepID=A0ABQ3L6G9_9PSEU|nr:hypothetical protein [Amycolatopsis oliviviridis]GHH06695.1 hypothetical protein GCM10017790_12520 [Amycolatopsis oliviviridis]
MPANRRRGVFVAALAATLAAGCSTEPEPPPAYRLNGDACGAVNPADFEALTRSTPTKTPSKLVAGLNGGDCKMEFDGSGGYASLMTFIAIHPSGEPAAKAMYDDFRKNDGERSRPGTDITVSDVDGLGSAAYLYRQRDDKKPWAAGEFWLYKYNIRHGSLVLTVSGSGYARDAAAWPATEEDMKAKVRKSAEETMKTLKP